MGENDEAITFDIQHDILLKMFWPLFSVAALKQQRDRCAEANNHEAVNLVFPLNGCTEIWNAPLMLEVACYSSVSLLAVMKWD